MGALPEINVAAREQRAFEAIAASQADALVVTSPTNICWLTGFTGSNAIVVAVGDELVLLTDNRYRDRAPVELARTNSSARVEIETDGLGERVAELVIGHLVVGLEAEHVTWARQRMIADEWLTDTELVATSQLLDKLRAAKDDAEIARIEAAARAVDTALGATVAMLADRPTEQAFANALEAAIRAGDADDIGFDTIVASGPNGAIPHHAPGDRVIEQGDLVIVDVGGKVDGYRSDMTRTFCVGSMTTAQARHYDCVIQAQQAGVEAMRVGAETASVDAAARAVIEAAGWADSFTHGTGHGIGLDIHELPRVSPTATDLYAAGTVATVEPGVYLRGEAGVRIEDTCLAGTTEARRLTRFPKDPEI